MWIFWLLSLNQAEGSCAFSILSLPNRATVIRAHLWILNEDWITIMHTSRTGAKSEVKYHVMYESLRTINFDSIFIVLIYRDLKIL